MPALHHLHTRKRVHKNLEPYPHPNKYKYILDHAVYFVGLWVVAMTVVQSAKIWIQKDATGVSLFAFSGYVAGNVIWFLYGLAHKDKPITFMYSMMFFANGSIALGAFLYS